MLDSERTFKKKVWSRWTVFKIWLRQQLFAFKEFCWKRDCPNITKLTKAIQKSPYKVLQVTSKWKTLKQPVYFEELLNFGLLLTFKVT